MFKLSFDDILACLHLATVLPTFYKQWNRTFKKCQKLYQ